MRKSFYTFVLVFVMALIGVSVAFGTSSDQGRRLTGPICVSLKPVGPVRAGTMRSVAKTMNCQSNEVRKIGVAGLIGPPGPKGDKGDKGDAGPRGNNGNDGKDAVGKVRHLCLIPDSYVVVPPLPPIYNSVNGGGEGDQDGDNTEYNILNRACGEGDAGSVDLDVLVPAS